MTIQDCKHYLLKLLACGTLFSRLNIADATITWTLPSPQRGPLQTSDTSVRTTIQQVMNGSSERHLKWNFTLSGEILDRVTFDIDDLRIGKKTSSGIVRIEPAGNFQEHFEISRSDPATLIIYNVTEADEAKFTCKVETSVRTWVDIIQVQIVAPPVISDILGKQTVNDSDLVDLTCRADGNPTPNITWTRVSDNNSVTFPFKISGKQDEGLYRCTADNGIGNPVSRDVFITVQYYHPINTSLTTNLSGDSVIINTTIKITCRAQANPPAKYQFYRNQVSLKNDTTGSDVSVITIPISERIKQVNYSCTPFNDFGAGPMEVITVTVFFPPAIIYAPPDYQVVEGKGAILFCNATGNPQPNITWTKQGNNSKLSTSETLNLTKLTREDDGSVYKCKVTNKVGSAEATTTITVFFQPKSVIHECNSQVIEDKRVTFYCNATGNPSPEVAWIRSGEVLVKDSAYVISAINRSQKGIYECMAWNGIGDNSTSNCTVDVQYPPTSTTMITLPSNTTLLRDAALSLKCKTDANPDAHIYHFYLNDSLTGNSSSGVFNTTVVTGVYTCIPVNTVGTGDNTTVNITAVVSPVADVTVENDTVNEGENVALTCIVSGDPFPSILWTKLSSSEVLSNKSSLTIVNVSRPGTPDNMIQYQCTASNGVGTPATDIGNVTVHYESVFV